MSAPTRRLAVALALLTAGAARAELDALLMRYPDVSATQVAFTHAGDIWLVGKQGGLAQRVSTPRGEETFPRFSPDGTQLAFSGNYDGNVDVYVMPTGGGVPRRLTHHPAGDRVLDWTPDGQGVLFASGREAGRDRYEQFFVVPVEGGLPRKLPVPYGSFGTLSPDGRTLAYTTNSRELSTWKRYRGGMTSEIWLYDLERNASQRISDGVVNDFQPVFAAGKLWFLSDRGDGLRANLWSRDLATGDTRQVTHFSELDARFPSAGPADIVFEHEGRLKLLDPATGAIRALSIRVVTDRATLKPRVEDVSEEITSLAISPSGKRVAAVARGDVFSVPEEKGVVSNLTRTSGTFERFATWSHDGKSLAWWSDATGEYELHVRPADGSGDARKVTSFGPGFRYRPWWSPDGQRIAFVDQAMTVHVVDVATGKDSKIDKGLYMFEGELRSFRPSWSPDSRWLAWGRALEGGPSALFLWDAKSGRTRQVTSGFQSDQGPVFDPTGKYLYFLTNRHFAPIYSDFDNSWAYANSTEIACIPLRKDVPSPLKPENDVEGEEDEEEDAAEEEDEPETKEEDAQAGDRGKPGRKKPKKPEKKDEPPAPVLIDLDGFEERVVVLPPEPGNHADLDAIDGAVVYRRLPAAGAAEDAPSPVLTWKLKDREEKTILEDADRFVVAAGRERALAMKDDAAYVVDVDEDQKLEKAVPLDGLEATIDPMAEWRQIFDDAWRIERDFFYDPGMHGVDWNAMRVRYGALLKQATTRADVNYVIGELIGELSSSHAYRGGGALERAPTRGVGMLGCDYALDRGRYRIARILDGAPWDSETRSPLRRPGVDVSEGDYLLAVNGAEVDVTKDPWAAFDGLAGKTIELTVNAKPALDGARRVVVEALDDEERLRQLDWVERNRRRVDERSGGKIGYVYVQDTGIGGQTDLVRMFYGQQSKPALLVDERFNSGGQIPDRFVELLSRKVTNYWAVRDGRDWQWPPVAHSGPKAMLINGWSGSGGDAFPFYFREAGLGPLIGRRTWGGLIGISGSPDLVDGGIVTVPTFAIYSRQGEWIIENHGVEPDIEVLDDPALMRDGADPQLDRGIDELMKQLEQSPPSRPQRPAYTKR